MANYQAFSASVQGAAHVKKNIVMQDASGKFENEKVKLIAVSDGHGDSSCFRSDRGSRLIVEVGIEELKAFADEMDGKEGELEETKNREIRVRQLIQRIITRWNIEVEKDLEIKMECTELHFLQYLQQKITYWHCIRVMEDV